MLRLKVIWCGCSSGEHEWLAADGHARYLKHVGAQISPRHSSSTDWALPHGAFADSFAFSDCRFLITLQVGLRNSAVSLVKITS